MGEYSLLSYAGGDGHPGIGEEHVSRAEEDRPLSSALRVAQKAVHWCCAWPGWDLLHTDAGEGRKVGE